MGDLKQALTTHLAAVTDAEHAQALLRKIEQKPTESVTVYSERLYKIARDAYSTVNMASEDAKAVIQSQMITSFTDG